MEMKRKWYQTTPAIIVLLFLFFPVGLFLMWKYSSWKKMAKVIVTGVFGFFMLASLIPSDNSSTKTASSTTNAQNQQQEVQAANTSSAPTLIPSPTSEALNKIVGDEAVVTKVVDGDTIAVTINGIVYTVRIIGINSPETVDPRKSVECFGQKASAMAKEKLTGKTIILEKDASQDDKDKYGRWLRYVWLDDGATDFGAFMIQNGYAYEYTYDIPYKYQSQYKQLQKEAETGKKGLWADDACPVAPIATTKPQTNTNSVQNQNTSGGTTTNTYSGGDKDCKDFSTQAEAQAYFNSKGGSATNNVDRLDGSDRDGVVCEALP